MSSITESKSLNGKEVSNPVLYHVLLLRADGTRESYGASKEPRLEWYQRMLKGPFEVLNCVYERRRCTMLVNEEGKIHNLPFNRPATLAWHKALPFRTNDVILGDVLILINYRLS